jgi:TIR domain
MSDSDQAGTFKYKAFISYAHIDQVAATWLHKALESYRIPKDLQGTPGRDGPIPKSLFPIFRDRDELSSSPDLSQSIQDGLTASAYLIVLCSPAAAKSRWVNQEVIAFKKLGRADRVYALIVDGDPGAAPEEGGAFPPALTSRLADDGTLIPDPSREVLAADLRPDGDGKDEAKLKLIAGLLGIPFNSLRRREAAAARKRLLVTQAIAASMLLLAIAAAVGGWLTWRYSQESDERQVPGVRVEYHETVLDLSQWHETTPAQIAQHQKISAALSHDRYTIVKTQPQATNYVHTVGTSSGIPPDIICTGCTIKERPQDAASRTSLEFRVEFDISALPLEQKTTVDYQTRYWNAFQTPDQWWTGVRVSDQTDLVKLTILFPPAKHAAAKTVQFYYHDNADHILDNPSNVTMDKDERGLVSSLTWTLASPSTDRSYRVRWDWNATTANAGE